MTSTPSRRPPRSAPLADRPVVRHSEAERIVADSEAVEPNVAEDVGQHPGLGSRHARLPLREVAGIGGFLESVVRGTNLLAGR